VQELRKYTLRFSQLCDVMQSGGTCQFFTTLVYCYGSRVGYIFGSQKPPILQTLNPVVTNTFQENEPWKYKYNRQWQYQSQLTFRYVLSYGFIGTDIFK
jgi:hypothetical protein